MASARELIAWAEEELSSASANPVLDATILLSEVTGIPRTHLLLHDEIDASASAQFRSVILRRIAGEPIQYITGRAYFRNLTVEVGPGVLIPRPESEALVDWVKARIQEISNPRVVDLGAGSGALALSVATEVPTAQVVAVERDERALHWLRRNIAQLKVDVEVVESDVADFDGNSLFDAVIANPPYIPANQGLPREVVNFEPHVALFGGEIGLEIPRVFAESAQRALRHGGFIAFEHHERQGEQVAHMMQPYFNDITLHYDLNQRPRWSSGVRK